MEHRLKLWIDQNQSLINKLHLKTEETIFFGKNNSGMRIDQSVQNYWGRITMWDTGSIILEIVDYDKGTHLLHEEILSETNVVNLDVVLKSYFKKFKELIHS